MKKTAIVISALVAMGSSQAFAETDYMFCYGGGRLGLYYSGIFPVTRGTKSSDKAKQFNAFVSAKYGTPILSECHSDLTQTNSAAQKQIREDSDQKSKFPSKLIETGWTGM